MKHDTQTSNILAEMFRSPARQPLLEYFFNDLTEPVNKQLKDEIYKAFEQFNAGKPVTLDFSDMNLSKLPETLLTILASLNCLQKIDLFRNQRLSSLDNLPLENCTSLEHLNLGWCTNLTALPDLTTLTNLKTLGLHYCRSLATPPALNTLSKLEQISFSGFDNLTSLPYLTDLSNLKNISFTVCYNLTTLPALNSLTNLKSIYLADCTDLITLPELNSLTKLEHLCFSSCDSLTSLPDLTAFTNLTSLRIFDCRKLTTLPALNSLTNLKHLDIEQCDSLTILPDLWELKNLQYFYIRGNLGIVNRQVTAERLAQLSVHNPRISIHMDQDLETLFDIAIKNIPSLVQQMGAMDIEQQLGDASGGYTCVQPDDTKTHLIFPRGDGSN